MGCIFLKMPAISLRTGNVHLGWCDDVWVKDFKALSPPPDVVEANSDGIDVDACQRVLIEDSYFSVSSTARKDGCQDGSRWAAHTKGAVSPGERRRRVPQKWR